MSGSISSPRRAFHVAPSGFAKGSILSAGSWGTLLRNGRPGGPEFDASSRTVLLWEMALEAVRLAHTPSAVSRLDCLFACKDEAAARGFRNKFRPDRAIYEIIAPPGTPCFEGDYDLISGGNPTEAYLDYMPAAAIRYWTEQPTGAIELLINGPVAVSRVIEG